MQNRATTFSSAKSILRVVGCVSSLLLFVLTATGQPLAVQNLRCEYTTSPMGIDVIKPRLSWQLTSTANNILQTAYVLRVAKSASDVAAGRNLIWNSGKVVSDASVFVPYEGAPLEAKTAYYWQVKVWDNQGHVSNWSSINKWEMGCLQGSDWTAQWIQTAEMTNGKVGPAPMFRKTFVAGKPIKSARLYITAHGLYEAEINGLRVSNEYFTPGWTSYNKRLQYQTHDVTAHLKTGNNAIGITVGDGWYRGNLEFNNKRNLYGKEVSLLSQLEVTYTDGTKEIIGTDASWKYNGDGPVRASDIYNGETYDARKKQEAWSAAAFSDAAWKAVAIASADKANLVAPCGPPVVKKETLSPLKVFTTPKGERVVDFGQNLVGWVELRLKGLAGDTVRLQHAEVLDKAGNFYTANLRGAKQENKYVLSGKEETYAPHFTFQGFRFAKIEGYTGPLDSTTIKAVALYSDMGNTGSFTTSNALVNQLQHNIQWGQKGNFLDVPTDCPQRDERLGWTADAQVFFNTAAYNMDVSGFFAKWLKDLRVDQLENGNVPVVIPNVRERRFSGSAGWADAATIIPWQHYLAYADKRMLDEQYSSMKAWVEYIRSSSKNNLSTVGSAYGDWLFYSPIDDKYGKAAITDRTMIAQVFYAYSTQNLLNAAKVLNNQEDIATYTSLLNNIKQAFQQEYLTPSGRLVSSSQTAYVLALRFDVLPEGLRQQAAARLVENIKEYKDHLTTGFLGTSYLCPVLSRFGYNDVAYTLLLQPTYPSWLYPVTMGATTVWERWDGIKPDSSFQNESMNSFNHYSYGAIGDWMYRVMAGINSDSVAAGYKRLLIAPKPGGEFTHVAAQLETMYGPVRSAWKMDGQKFSLAVTIPPNTRATVVLPQSSATTISGLPTARKGGEDVVKAAGNDTRIELGSGTYTFDYLYKK